MKEYHGRFHYIMVPKKEKTKLKRVIKFLSAIWVIALLFISSITVHAQNADSIKAAQQKRLDSVKAAQRQRSDSLNFIRNYMQSKHYKDSVENARQKRVLMMKEAQQRSTDSLTAVRKKAADSIMTARRRYSDSIRNYNDSIKLDQVRKLEAQKVMRKRVSDSLESLRIYKASEHYKDSVALARKTAKDNLAAARKRTNDSIGAIQRAITDSIVAGRKAYNDSLKSALAETKALRMLQLDSLAKIRAARTDSLAKVREARAELRKQKAAEKEKAKKDKFNLNMELKIKKKQDAYTNEKMRKKSWSLPRKVVQNTFTRYNYYFNADKKMDEAIENMVRSNTDNYDSLLALFPFNPDRDSSKLLSDMDTIIRKASVGIQIHDPRAKWQDDLYLLVGQAYYYKGDYQNAGAAFKHIVAQAEADKRDKEKKDSKDKKAEKSSKPITYSEEEKTGLAGVIEHKSAKNDAMLWLSRTLTQNKKEGQAQTLLDMLRNDALFPERLKGRLALEQAFADLSRNDNVKAAQSLSTVADDKELPDWLRRRASYLNGQILQQELHYVESDKYFGQVLKLNPDIEMDFYARKNIVTNSINNGTNNMTAAQMLDKMAGDGKYRPYYDQIYFAMGKTALKNKQNDKAIESFKKSVALSQSNKKQKGLSFAALGDEYYVRSDYKNAKSAYDSATMFLTIAQDPVFSIAKQRALALDKIAAPGTEVKIQDSLLRLASLSEKEQRNIIRDYIRSVERLMQDSAYRAEHSGGNNVTIPQNNAPGSQTWYFANPNLMKQGENEFKQKWGNRTLKDNWRRSNVSSGTFDLAEAEETNTEEVSNLPDEDSLYAAIPRTPEQLQKAKAILREALFNLGKGYYTYLEDYPKAMASFDTLESRFPEHEHKAEVLYTRYLITMRQNQPSVAAQYNAQLQSKYAESEWAKLLKGSSALQTEEKELFAASSNTPKETLSNHYDETYGLLLQRQYSDVLRRIKDADEQYKNQGDFRKKYDLMKAISIAGTGNYPEADTMLNQFITTNPSDTLTNWARTVLKFIRSNPLPAAAGVTNTAGINQPVINPVVDSNNLGYIFNGNQPHYVLIAAQQDAKFSGLKSGLSDYNLMKGGNENIVVTMSTLDAGRSLIICKEFPTAAAAKKYLAEIKNVKLLFREYQPSEYELLLISADNFPKLFVKKDYAVYKSFYGKNYK